MAKINDLADNLDYIRPSKDYVVQKEAGFCDACGGLGPFSFAPIIRDQLAKEWTLSKAEHQAFSSRESMFCAFCGCSYRLRALAKAIVLETGSDPTKSLEDAIRQTGLEAYKIAEINACGVLHNILKDAKHLSYSEYGSKDKSIPSQDLSSLTYKDKLFDLVLTSDSLEHVPDPKAALQEIYRVLKPKGKHIFTVPMVLDRSTKTRSVLQGETIKNIEPPSFHGSGEPDYLVWSEFGGDFIALMQAVGFSVKLYFQNTTRLNDPSCVIVAAKGRFEDKIIRVDNQCEDLQALKKNPAFADKIFKPVDVRVQYGEELQIKKVGQLQEKLTLTTQHSKNMQELNGAYLGEIKKMRDFIKSLESTIEGKDERLRKILNSPAGTLYKKLKALLRK